MLHLYSQRTKLADHSSDTHACHGDQHVEHGNNNECAQPMLTVTGTRRQAGVPRSRNRGSKSESRWMEASATAGRTVAQWLPNLALHDPMD